MMYQIKDWQDLTIQDDYMFKLIMSRKRICKKMLEKILRISIDDLVYIEDEKSMKASYDSKGVRLDVYVKDDKHTVYNIEMQVRKPENEGLYKRTRYYQSMIDGDLLKAGVDYDELNPTYIIFICPFEPFHEGRHMYTFRNYCTEDKDIELQDGTVKLFLNTKGTMDDVEPDVKAFLEYVDGVMSPDEFVQEIDEAIRNVKTQESERVRYMTYTLKLKEERKIGHEAGFREGMEKGIEKGLQKGTQKGKLETALKMLRNGISMEIVLKCTNLPPSAIKEAAEKSGLQI